MNRTRSKVVARVFTPLLLVATALWMQGVRADDFGRLFSSPDERARLDELRRTMDVPPPPVVVPVDNSVEPLEVREPTLPSVQQFTVNGVVLRSSGHHASWVNGAQVLRGDTAAGGVQIEPDGSRETGIRIHLPSGLDTVTIKPGQKIDVIDGKVFEPYQPGARSDEQSAFAAETPVTGGEAQSVPQPELDDVPTSMERLRELLEIVTPDEYPQTQ